MKFAPGEEDIKIRNGIRDYWVVIDEFVNELSKKPVEDYDYEYLLHNPKEVPPDKSLIAYQYWNNFEDGDIGEALTKVIAAYAHTIDFYKNWYIENLYLPNDDLSSTEQINEMLNVKKGMMRAAIITINFRWTGCGPIIATPIPRFTRMSVTADDKTMELLVARSYMYMPYSARLYVDAIAGKLKSIYSPYNEIGKNNNRVFLGTDDIDSDSVFVSVDDKEWTQVYNIFYHPNPTYNFSVHHNEEGYWVYFASNWREYVPSNVSDIKIEAVLITEEFDLHTKESAIVCLLDDLICLEGEIVTEMFDLVLMDSRNATTYNAIVGDGKRIITLVDYEKEALTYNGVKDCKAVNWDL
jgi:hypothetical protein